MGSIFSLIWVTANQIRVILNDHLYPVIKYFQSDRCTIIQDHAAPTRRSQQLTESFDEDENEVNLCYDVYSCQILNYLGSKQEQLDSALSQHHQKKNRMQYILEEWCSPYSTLRETQVMMH